MQKIKLKLSVGIIAAVLGLAVSVSPAAVPDMGQIENNQQALEKENDLLKRVGTEEKAFVKKIMVKGVTKVTPDKIREITAPLEKKWLSKADFQLILDALKELYRKETGQIPAITYTVKHRQMEITVIEATN